MPEGSGVDSVYGLAQIQFEVLTGPLSLAMESDGGDSRGHDGDTYAGTETVR